MDIYDELYATRRVVGRNVLKLSKERGYGKVDVANGISVSRPTLDSILNGEIKSRKTYIEQIKKLITLLQVPPETLLQKTELPVPSRQVGALAYTYNAPDEHQLSRTAQDGMESLTDLLELCRTYYG